MTTPLRIDALDDPMTGRLEAFAAAVRDSPHNLLSRRGLEELETRHIGESVGFALKLPDEGRAVLDLGTGGGFPGMVIAIVRPDLHVTLLDATAKKVRFLEEFAAAHGIAVRALIGRAEEIAATHAGSFDLVTARAVAPLERLIPWSLPFLRPGGALYAIKGERWQEELAEAAPILRASGAAVVDVLEPIHSDEARGVAPAPRVVIIRRPG